MIRLVLVGAAGRMGRAVEQAAGEADGFELKARVVAAGDPLGSEPGWSGSIADSVSAGDVVIEFSSPAAARETAEICAERRAALVSGTTGLSPEEDAAIQRAARRTAVLRAANFSLGVLALRRALAAALLALPRDWDVEIVERHHRRKLDSPSGTAMALAREAAALRELPAEALRHGRQGRAGPRPAAEIGVHAVRGGSWVGDHLVLLAGEGEWLELRHVAQDRGAFAQGALAAAQFVATASPGLYTLEQVLTTQGRTH